MSKSSRSELWHLTWKSWEDHTVRFHLKVTWPHIKMVSTLWPAQQYAVLYGAYFVLVHLAAQHTHSKTIKTIKTIPVCSAAKCQISSGWSLRKVLWRCTRRPGMLIHTVEPVSPFSHMLADSHWRNPTCLLRSSFQSAPPASSVDESTLAAAHFQWGWTFINERCC